MTTQLERNPRDGRELTTTLPRSWIEVLAFSLCVVSVGAGVYGVVHELNEWGAVVVLLGLTCFIVGCALSACRKPGAHL